MEIKKVWAMYFSPTGGTEKAVRTVSAHVAESLGVPVEIEEAVAAQDFEKAAQLRDIEKNYQEQVEIERDKWHKQMSNTLS